MKEIYAIQNDTVDAICWREYGRSTGVVEQVLEANPHLSEFGPFIPIGTKVQLPDIPTQQNKVQSIQLWD
ncbi:tail protein X [Acinetobacter baumannii]|nr:tail protein X [Acinetobacter baumannii]MDC4898118.1 tail protein X [Acinetobacter baumannii]MDC4901809.1 tail protein X [Acinetobacter baumannii]MDC4909007.1 tail protein X [Acinetobacter baumannii]MDC4915716.1 tail protein X [Acinetobacter baumannii]